MAGEFLSGQSGWVMPGLAPGSLVAGYRVEARIGAGGMAMVLRARDEALGRTVALKILAPSLAGDTGFRERFVRESRAVAAVDHAHIIPVYAAGESDGVLYLAMRYVASGDLRAVVQREGPLPGLRAATLISPIGSALDAAHAAGLVHRDVKPANILIDIGPSRPEHPYLSDFGLAKGPASSTGLTGTGQFLGTPDYAAPEQISGKPASPQTDQYALACVVYTVLTASLPFPRDEPMAVLWAHMYEPPPSLATWRPDLPAAADNVLAKALAKAPAERYATCGDFTGALLDALGPASRAGSGLGSTVSGLAAADGTGRGQTSDGSNPLSPSRTQTITPHPSFPPGADMVRLQQPRTSLHSLAPIAAGSGPWPAESDGRGAAPSARSRSTAAPQGPGSAQAAATLPPLGLPRSGTTHAGHLAGPRRRRPSPRVRLAVIATVLLAAVGTTATLLISPGQPSQSRATAGRTPSGKATARVAATSSSPAAAQIAKAQPVAALPNSAGGEVMVVAFGPGGMLETIGTSSNGNGSGYSFDIATRRLTQSVRIPEPLIDGSGITPDGKLLVEASRCEMGCGGSVLNATSGRQVGSLAPQVTFDGYSLGDATLASANGARNGVDVWSLASGTLLATLTNPDDHFEQGSAVSANGKVVAVGSDGGPTHHIYVWNATSQTLLDTLTIPTVDGEVQNPDELSSDGTTLAVGIGTTARIYDTTSGRLIRTLPASLGSLSPDGNLMAAPAAKGIQIWDIATGKVTQTLQESDSKDTSPNSTTMYMNSAAGGFAIAFSPSGKSVAAGFGSMTDVWNLPGA
jgi:serine/threonine-protein kinase